MNSWPFDTSRIRSLGWLLALQPLLWVATVYIALTAIFSAGDILTWTPAIMAERRSSWLMFYMLMLLGFLSGAVPLLVVARMFTATPARRIAWIAFICGIISVVLGLGYIALRVSVINFTAPALADTLALKLTGDPGILTYVWDLFEYLTMAALGICLWRTHAARRTGVFIALVSVVLIPFGVNKPPFLISLLWLVLGVTLLRQGTRSQTSTLPVSGLNR